MFHRRLHIACFLLPMAAYSQNAFDAAILSYEGLDRLCDGSITPVVRIQNQGTNTMNTCVVDILRNGVVDNSFNWILALPAAQGDIRKPALPEVTGLQDGDELTFRIMSVNGIPDEEAIGNEYLLPVLEESEPSASYRVRVDVQTDANPGETTWALKDAMGNVVACGGQKVETNALDRKWVELAPENCYSLQVNDAGGDGMDDRAVPGYVKVIGLDTEVISVDGGSFTDTYEDALRSSDEGCAITQLTSSPDDVVSCGSSVYLNGTSTLYAREVPGATRYQFRFTWGTYVRHCASPTADMLLVPWATLPLKPGRFYQVAVRVSFDGGATYCPFGPSCQIRTRYNPAASPRNFDPFDEEEESPMMDLFPNPNDGQRLEVELRLGEVDARTALLHVSDLTGREVWSGVLPLEAGSLRTSIQPNVPWTPGLYLVSVQAGSVRTTERLVVR